MSVYTDRITGISHDFSTPLSAGKGMWFCTVHGKECSPYGPGDPKAIADYLLSKAANDPALPDDVFVEVARAVEPPALDRGLHPFVLDDSRFVHRPDGTDVQVGRCGHERDDPSHTKSDIENQALGETK